LLVRTDAPAKICFMSRVFVYVLLITGLFASVGARADENTERAVSIREANLYLSPDTNSQKLATVDRGREVAVLEHSGPQWLHVLASLGGERDVSGWILDKGLVRKTTPNGDQILFGEAADSEAEVDAKVRIRMLCVSITVWPNTFPIRRWQAKRLIVPRTLLGSWM
jgi:hypothetical protein